MTGLYAQIDGVNIEPEEMTQDQLVTFVNGLDLGDARSWLMVYVEWVRKNTIAPRYVLIRRGTVTNYYESLDAANEAMAGLDKNDCLVLEVHTK
jgi:hypothetical protein